MAAENSEPGAQPAVPARVNQELPTLGVARQNFREKVQAFVNEFEKHETPSAGGPFSDNYHKLQGFLNNTGLPKRNQEKELINAMMVMAAQVHSKKEAEKTMDKAALDEMAGKFKGIIKEAKTAEEEFDKAYEEDKKQTRNPTAPGFVVGSDNKLYQYNDTNERTGAKVFGVMSTSNTPEGFKDALNYYANSKDENGNSRKFTNVNFGKPTVSAQQLKESAGLKDNFHQQVLDALDANLYPEKEIEKLVEALTGPSMNSRAHFLTSGKEDKLKAKQLEELSEEIDKYKGRRDGILEQKGQVHGSVEPSQKADQTAKISMGHKLG